MPWLDIPKGAVGVSYVPFSSVWGAVDVTGFGGVPGVTVSSVVIGVLVLVNVGTVVGVLGAAMIAGALDLGAGATPSKASMLFRSAAIISLDRVSTNNFVSGTILAMIARVKAVTASL